MLNSMNEFEFRPDRTTDYGVSCPWASKKYPRRPYNGENGVSTFSLLFLIGSFWYFHVTRTSIKAWMRSNFLKWDLTLVHWTQVSDRCPLSYLFFYACQVFSLIPSKSLYNHYPRLDFGKYWRNITHLKLLTISIAYGVSIERDIQHSFCEMKVLMSWF